MFAAYIKDTWKADRIQGKQLLWDMVLTSRVSRASMSVREKLKENKRQHKINSMQKTGINHERGEETGMAFNQSAFSFQVRKSIHFIVALFIQATWDSSIQICNQNAQFPQLTLGIDSKLFCSPSGCGFYCMFTFLGFFLLFFMSCCYLASLTFWAVGFSKILKPPESFRAQS